MTEALPEIRGEQLGADGSLLLSLFVPASLPQFTGHFPGHPILPGVLQVHWAVHLGTARFAIPGRFSRLINLKFQKPILPDSELTLNLSYDPLKQQLAFVYSSAKGSHASGKIEFAANISP